MKLVEAHKLWRELIKGLRAYGCLPWSGKIIALHATVTKFVKLTNN